jgi:RHH-type proline utilization regulon transcriptional repressor/proline dehydrogenase/delta 1-pyrroline-5-carboxylate dehydrogenase
MRAESILRVCPLSLSFADTPMPWTDALKSLPPLGDPYRAEDRVIAELLDASGGGAGNGAAPGATVAAAELRGALRGAARATAARWIEAVRATPPGALSAQNLLATFPLNSTEGVALLRLAEALLRAPDAATQTWLIAEKLAAFRYGGDTGEGLVARVLNTALRFAGQFTGEVDLRERDTAGIREWLARSALRPMVIDGIRRFGEQFVFAQSLPQALDNAAARPDVRITYSYDMLGEGARAADDADRSHENYRAAIAALAATGKPGHFSQRDGISVKLSAIHPRFETAQWQRVERELYARLLELARQARDADINFTIDAEESERLVLQIALLERLMREPSLAGWEGLGLAVQAYQTRAAAAIDHLLALAKARHQSIAIRLVKGAYWDAEIKRAQELGLAGFPVFTRKWATDLAYAVLALRLLTADAPVYPQFATHNSLTAAWICAVADQLAPKRRFEFQRLHGMGEPLYRQILAERPDALVRVYAPVGAFRDLLAYLVRRLLENGANTSFVHQIADEATPVADLLADPFEQAAEFGVPMLIPTGARLFGARANSAGRDLADSQTLLLLAGAVERAPAQARAAPIVDGVERPGTAIAVHAPARLREAIGHVVEASDADTDAALAAAAAALPAWDARGAAARATLLEAAAAAYEREHDTFVRLLVHEAGKTALDAHLEVREAVDFLRYYAAEARRLMVTRDLPGPTGESNELMLHGRGVFVCISPWNFPLAIFTGQVAAALVTGNTVIAKPAEQTPLVAAQAVRLLHGAGVPGGVLHLVPGRGETVGRRLASDARVAGVAFTGSTDTARAINRALAARDAPIGVLIAETGGQNAMLVDSTALPEQVTDAVVSSAFRSTGQRCSALRVLYLQNDIADGTLAMIAGAMRELKVGDPRDPAVDVGPVIDRDALEQLERHRDWLRANARRICETELPAGLDGHYFAPVAYEIGSMRDLVRENFGPILHVVRFDRDQFDAKLDEINASGYGLTMGLHTRLDARVAQVRDKARAGNLYVNRNIIGAVVETQPFGGEGLSGTGPKAGGPFYLQRFCAERTVTINTAAAGGNIELAAGLS